MWPNLQQFPMDLLVFTAEMFNGKIFYANVFAKMVIVNDDLFNLKVTRINIAAWTESWHKIAVSTYITY